MKLATFSIDGKQTRPWMRIFNDNACVPKEAIQ